DGGVARRVAFPMRSVMDLDGSGQSSGFGSLHDPIEPRDLAAAHEASIFWQVEALDHAGTVDFFKKKKGVCRGRDSFTKTEQEDRLRRGFQLIQTDYPWVLKTDASYAPSPLPCDPRRRLFDPDEAMNRRFAASRAFIEPGDRIYFSARGE